MLRLTLLKGNPLRNLIKKLVGAHKSFAKPQLPKRDDVVSPGKTPEQEGARPCRHCGSGRHWDFDHLFSTNNKQAKTFLVNLDSEAKDVLVAYENCFYQDSDIAEDEEETLEEIDSDQPSEQEDFPSPLE